jgi:hypothetical protein
MKTLSFFLIINFKSILYRYMKSFVLPLSLSLVVVVMFAYVQTRQHTPTIHKPRYEPQYDGLGDWELTTTNIESYCLVHRKR